MIDQIIEAWQTNNRMNLLLISSLDAKSLEARPIAKREGRNVRHQLIHMCNVRYAWMVMGARAYVGRMKKISRESMLTPAQLKKAFKESADAIEKFLRDACEGRAALKGFKKNPVTFMGYLIAHDSHHRGQILLALKQSGMMVDKKVQYGIWEWYK
jgi:uncharacterized damage-inducible protein DinB